MAANTIYSNINIDDFKALQFITTHANLATCQTTPDNITWTGRTMPGAASLWKDVTFGNDLAVAVASGSMSAVSSDGITWYSGVLPSFNSWNAVAYGSGVFVTIAGSGTPGSNRSAYSYDGVTWTAKSVGVTADWRCLKFVKDKFIALGYNSNLLVYSYDGVNWTSGNMNASKNWSVLAYDSSVDRFSAISDGAGNICVTSNDGISWSGNQPAGGYTCTSLVSNNSGTFVGGTLDSLNIGLYSIDGGYTYAWHNWPATSSWSQVAYSPYENIFVAMANTTVAAKSTDGLYWTLMTKVTSTPTAITYAPFSWRSGDTFTIINGATVTYNTEQKKFFYTYAITNGLLKVENLSTSGTIRFISGRTVGALAQTITPSTGLGNILISGKMIDIGIGSGVPNQVITTPYTDQISSIWVEKGFNSGVYEIWNNVLSSYGKMMHWPDTQNGGFNNVSSGRRGMFFTQDVNPVYDRLVVLPGCSGLNGTRKLTVSSTSGILTGAYVSGNIGIPTGTVVENIVSSTVLELNQMLTINSSIISGIFINPLKDQLLNTIRCGDGVNGNVFPSGARIQIPNIMCTSDTPVNIQADSHVLGMSLVMTNGGGVKIENVLHDDVYHNLTQSSNCTLKNVGFCIAPLISEVYNLNVNSIGVIGSPPRRIYKSTLNGVLVWANRESTSYYGNNRYLNWTYISNAVINDLVFSSHNVNFIAGAITTSPTYFLASKNMTISNARFYNFNASRATRSAIYNSYVFDSTFTNIESYGLGAMYNVACVNLTMSGVLLSDTMFNDSRAWIAGSRITYDAETGLDMIPNQKYYFKARTYFTKDRSVYTESRLYSSTPFLGARLFPDYLGCNCTASQTVVFDWTNRSPVFNYEIYRSETPGFVTRDFTTKVMETATAATVTWTNGPRTQAIPTAGTDTWTWAAAGKTLTRSAGTGTSFLTLGYTVGDVIDITETVSNNGTKVITAVTATVMTFANVGSDIQTVNAEAASAVGKINGRTPVNGTTYYYVFRKYDSAGVYSESAEQEVTTTAPVSNLNLILQSNTFDNASWTKTGVTVTVDQERSPVTSSIAPIASSNTADKLLATRENGLLSQPFTTISGQPYTFSLFHRTDPGVMIGFQPYELVSGFIGLSGSVSNFPQTTFVSSGTWTRSNVTIVASGTSTTAYININNSGRYILGSFAVANSGITPQAPILTTTFVSGNINEVQDINKLRVWCRGYGDATTHSGIEFGMNAAVLGGHYTDVFCGTSGTFTPTAFNKIFSTDAGSYNYIGTFMSTSNNIVMDNIQQVGRSVTSAIPFYTDVSTKNTTVKNFNYDFGCFNTIALIGTATEAGSMFCHNWNITNYRNYVALNPITVTNLGSNFIFQNIRFDKSDYPLNLQTNNTIVKGLSFGNATPANAATTYAFGSITDGVAVSYVAIYDNIFNELYFTDVSGCLHILCNGSSKESKPYITVSGNPYFSNTGKLYLQNAGDSLEWTWPHKILGVSGFSSIRPPKTNGLDLGTSTLNMDCLRLDYSINTGSGYSAYRELTTTNIGSEVVHPVSGFYFKVKATAVLGMKYGTKNTDFIEGEVIRGQTTNATATVVRVIPYTSLTGTIWLSNVVGTFGIAENILLNSDSTLRAANVATNVNYALCPSFTSYVDGIQIYTHIDKSVLYPTEEVSTSLVLTGLQPNSEVRIYRTADDYPLGGVENSSGNFTYNYMWDDKAGDDNVYIRIIANNYQWMTLTNQVLGKNGLTIPIQQVYDRQYQNL